MYGVHEDLEFQVIISLQVTVTYV